MAFTGAYFVLLNVLRTKVNNKRIHKNEYRIKKLLINEKRILFRSDVYPVVFITTESPFDITPPLWH